MPADWVSRIKSAFRDDAELALLFCRVSLPPEDRVKGYAAEFEPSQVSEFRHSAPDVHAPWGIGANMSMRRAMIDQIGVFDLMLGAGAMFHAGEEIDLTLRALACGFKVVHTPQAGVLHLGIREGAAASRLMRGYGVGLGATLTKHVRIGTPGVARLLAHWLAIHGQRSLRRAIQGHKKPGFDSLRQCYGERAAL